MSERASGAKWPWIIAGMLVVNVAASVILIVIAGSGESHAVEPDYYEKAVAWDEHMAQERTNERLGWRVETRLIRDEEAGAVALRAQVVDGDGDPVTGADIAIEAFHRARAADRRTVRAEEVAPGVYVTGWRGARLGLWELRYRIRGRAELFTHETVATLFGRRSAEAPIP